MILPLYKGNLINNQDFDLPIGHLHFFFFFNTNLIILVTFIDVLVTENIFSNFGFKKSKQYLA